VVSPRAEAFGGLGAVQVNADHGRVPWDEGDFGDAATDGELAKFAGVALPLAAMMGFDFHGFHSKVGRLRITSPSQSKRT
jgi:hypothetical protein